jgi:hypothetical protein
LDIEAVLAQNSARVEEVMRQELASPEHARFVKRLELAHRRRS